jgi:RNA polymerase sigma factor (sigma-70 family)
LPAPSERPLGDPREIDERTLLAARRREPHACRELLARYERRVYAFLWRMLRPRCSAAIVDELCQETFLRVFAHLQDFKADGSARLSTWILTVATRLALNQLRRKELEQPAPDFEDQPSAGCTEFSAARAELVSAVTAAVASLPPEQRSVLLLREYHDLDYTEIAAALNLELGTVRSRLSRARRRIRERLERYLPNDEP